MPGINPLNEKLKKQYEETLLHGRHRQRRTVDAVWKAITLFENSTGRQPFTSFNATHAKDFKQWLSKQVNEKGQPLSLATLRSTLANVREFFLWLRAHAQVGRKIDSRGIDYLHLSQNEDRAARASKPRPQPTIEQITQAINAMPFTTDIEKRDRALMALLAITAMRDGALASLRLGDVDITTRTVWQDPKHVKTKFGKAILTAWVPINPEFEAIVIDWVTYMRDDLGYSDKDPLFPATRVEANPEKMAFEVTGLSDKPWASAAAIRKIFKDAFTRAGLPTFHPHSCRHMLITWGIENLSQEEFKALSQNLGHDHAMTTYNAYGTIPAERQIKLIRGMNKGPSDLSGLSETQLLAELMRRKGQKTT